MGQPKGGRRPASTSPTRAWHRLTRREKKLLSAVVGGFALALGIVSGIAQFVSNYAKNGLELLGISSLIAVLGAALLLAVILLITR